jgi:hypothetical protein
MTTTKTPKATRRPAPALHPRVQTHARDAAAERRPEEVGAAELRRQTADGAQTKAGGAGTPLAPTVASPSQSTETEREPITVAASDHSPARPIVRAILSTLDATAALSILSALATFARAIIEAAAMLRRDDGGPSMEGAFAMMDAARELLANHRAAEAAYAITALWWSETPACVLASFWHDEIARENTESNARGVLEEVEALRAELRASTAEARVALVEDAASLVAEEESAAGDAVKGCASDLMAHGATGAEAMLLARRLAELGAYNAARAVERCEPVRPSLVSLRDALAVALRAAELGVSMEGA